MADPTPPAAPHRAALTFIFITVLLDVVAMGIITPVLPKMLVDMLEGDTRLAAEYFGLFGTAFAVMQFIFSPVTGALSDRVGRRPVILLSNLGLGLDYILMALAPTVGWLFAGRVISGITTASMSTAHSYLADVTPEDQRAGSYGLIGVAFGIGFILGPVLGSALGDVSPQLPFWVAAGLSLANALYGIFVLPESLPPERRSKVFQWRSVNPVSALLQVGTRPGLRGLVLVSFLMGLAHVALPSVFVLYTGYRYDWDGRTVSLALALTGAMSLLIQGLVVRRVLALVGERRTMLLGLMFGAVGFCIFGLASTGSFMWIGIVVTSLWGLYGPTSASQMSRYMSDSERGQLTGTFASIMGITGMAGPTIFTQLFALGIAPERGWNLPGAPFLFGMVLIVSAALIASRVTLPDSETAPAPAPAPPAA